MIRQFRTLPPLVEMAAVMPVNVTQIVTVMGKYN
jgi:hypothetical protein